MATDHVKILSQSGKQTFASSTSEAVLRTGSDYPLQRKLNCSCNFNLERNFFFLPFANIKAGATCE